ncbi:MAG: pyridoxal phosphate-dependent decarboxylase family protein [Vicinamibacterales bacterium]
MYEDLLARARAHALAYLSSVDARHVGTRASRADLLASLGGPLPPDGSSSVEVIERLAAAADPGLVASVGPRYFGFVTGGVHPAALAADWLASAWDQNLCLYVMSPAGSVIEDVAAGWVIEALGLPPQSSVGFATGAQMANMTGLAAARHDVLRRAGWDVEALGLQGAPRVHVIAGAEAHASIFASLRLLGFGRATVRRAAADNQGRMRPAALVSELAACDGPTIVCAQAGHVGTGAFDPFDEIVAAAHARGAWVHVDGAFGLWAAASPLRRRLAAGVERADSWATDGHKWLNVPYDCGIVVCAHSEAHRAAMSEVASYFVRGGDEQRNGMDWVPEASRRARAVPVYAAMRALGRDGLAALVDRCCSLAARMAATLRDEPGIEVLNDVVLNQVLVRCGAETAAVIARVQQEGVCWLGGTRWQGRDAMRISVSNWLTTGEDIDRSAASIIRSHRSVNARVPASAPPDVAES